MADTPRHDEAQAEGREDPLGSSGQERAGKIAAGDRALQWTKKPGFNRKWARLLAFGFGALAFLAVALSLERHPQARVSEKKRSTAYQSEIPSTLEVGPADYAGWQTRSAAEGAASGETGYRGTGLVAHAVPTVTYGAVDYGTYREVGPEGGGAVRESESAERGGESAAAELLPGERQPGWDAGELQSGAAGKAA